MLDPSLRGFVEAADEAEAEQCLAALLEEHAAPLVRRIAARKLAYGAGQPACAEDLEDIVSDALLALVSRLQSLREDAKSAPIESFTDYTAVVAYNAFSHYLRRKHPERSRLKNRLRYLLTRERRFGLWQTPDGPTCGLAAWRPGHASPEAVDKLDRLTAEPERWLRWTLKRPTHPDEHAALLGVLEAIGGPVEFERLVGAFATMYPVEKVFDSRSGLIVASVPDETAPPADLALDQRRLTERLWLEIGSLPLRQRVALLLSLRDDNGSSVLWILPLMGTASMRQIARALEMPDLELAGLWNRLPLDDHGIAARLGCSRQQAINLRGAARKRLTHRLNQTDAADGSPEASANKPAASISLEGKA